MFEAHKIAAASQGLWDAAERLGSSVERMIAIQESAFPNDWSPADKRELAEKHLFGERK
jgi:hypothetical protein